MAGAPTSKHKPQQRFRLPAPPAYLSPHPLPPELPARPQWRKFRNPARGDDLELEHWVKCYRDAAGAGDAGRRGRVLVRKVQQKGGRAACVSCVCVCVCGVSVSAWGVLLLVNGSAAGQRGERTQAGSPAESAILCTAAQCCCRCRPTVPPHRTAAPHHAVQRRGVQEPDQEGGGVVPRGDRLSAGHGGALRAALCGHRRQIRGAARGRQQHGRRGDVAARRSPMWPVQTRTVARVPVAVCGLYELWWW